MSYAREVKEKLLWEPITSHGCSNETSNLRDNPLVLYLDFHSAFTSAAIDIYEDSTA